MTVCTEHSGVCVNMENILKQTESNTKDIKTLSDAVIKLTILVENINQKRSKFWDADTKKYGLRLGFILCIVLIFALTGTNIISKIDITKFLN